MRNKLSRKLEEYLETIYYLKEEEGKKVVRVKDIATRMNVSMPSVTDALTRLSDMGYVEYEKRGYIDLTEKGLQIAKELYRTEKLLITFLSEMLLLDKKLAETESCKLEHDLSRETIKRLEMFIGFLSDCYDLEIVDRFKRYLKTKKC
ncbi:MAG: metal-dependent transcriptional regulator [Candidatus Njordarchaeia archaeon]